MPMQTAVVTQLEVFERPFILRHSNGTRPMSAIGGTPRPRLSVWTNPEYPASHEEQRRRRASRSEPRLGWGKLVGIDPSMILGGAL